MVFCCCGKNQSSFVLVLGVVCFAAFVVVVYHFLGMRKAHQDGNKHGGPLGSPLDRFRNPDDPTKSIGELVDQTANEVAPSNDSSSKTPSWLRDTIKSVGRKQLSRFAPDRDE